jgi:Zn-dependent protease
MSTPVEGGRALLRGRVLGFPVHVDVSFLLVMGLFGYSYWSGSLRDIVLWVVIATVAVLAHELGHAVAARAAGAQPHIALVGFGGITTFTPPGPLSRVRSLGISLAGPAVGLVLGVALIAVDFSAGSGLDPFGWQRSALTSGEFTCLGWSVLNLLPVLPLDGGQAMRELLPGDPEVRTRRAAVVSVVTAGLAALAAAFLGQLFLAMFMLFFGASNVLALRGPRRARAGGEAEPGPASPEQAVVGLLWRNDPAGARRLMESLPEGTPVDLAVHGAVLALTGDPAGGHALLDQEIRRRPTDPNAVALLILTQTLEHDWDAVLVTLHGPLAPAVPQAVMDRAVAEAQGTGRGDVAGRIAALHRPA